MALWGNSAALRADGLADRAQGLASRAQSTWSKQERRLAKQLDSFSDRLQDLGGRLRAKVPSGTRRWRRSTYSYRAYLTDRRVWLGAGIAAAAAGATALIVRAVRRRRRPPENPDLVALRKDFDYALGELGYSIDDLDAAALLEEAQAALDGGADVEATRAKLRERAAQMSENARRGARRAVGNAQRLVRERPLIMSAAGLALGAAVLGGVWRSRAATRPTNALRRWRRAA